MIMGKDRASAMAKKLAKETVKAMVAGAEATE